MPPQREDRFANIAAARVTESAAGTITFTEMLTGISLGQGVGMLIDQIDYYVGFGTLEDVVDLADRLHVFVGSSDDVTDPAVMTDRRILHSMGMTGVMVGAVVSLTHEYRPRVYQFFPPLIIAAPRLYLGILGVSLASPAVADVRIYFRYVGLSPQQYLELAESFVLTG